MRALSAESGNDPLAPRAAPVPAMREEEALLAGRAEAHALDLGDAGGAEGPLGGLGQVEPPADHDVVAVALPERLGHLLPDLVAADADAGADPGGDLPAAERVDAGVDDPGEEAL